MEWSLCLAILKLRKWLVYSVVSLSHSVEKGKLAPSARPWLKCKDGLPLSVMTMLKTIYAPNIEWSGWNMMWSIPIMNAINLSPMCLLYSRIQSKRILFPNLWANDKLSSTSTRTLLNYHQQHDSKLRTKLITTMKTLKNIMCLAMKLNESLYLFNIGRLLQRRKSEHYYCSSEPSQTKMGCYIRIASRSLSRRQSHSIWQFITSRVGLFFV